MNNAINECHLPLQSENRVFTSNKITYLTRDASTLLCSDHRLLGASPRKPTAQGEPVPPR